MRVYELAREMGLPISLLIAKIRALGLEVNNLMSSLDADDVRRIKLSLETKLAVPPHLSQPRPSQPRRVYELAKEAGLPNKDLIARIRALGIEVSNHMSALDADDVRRIRLSLKKAKQAALHAERSMSAPAGAAQAPVIRRRVIAEGTPSAPHAAASSPPGPVVRAAELPAAPATPVTGVEARTQSPEPRADREPQVESRAETPVLAAQPHVPGAPAATAGNASAASSRIATGAGPPSSQLRRPREVPERFLVALSFSGVEREFVRAIAEAVEHRLGPSSVFFDEWFDFYIGGHDADTKLQRIYGDSCELAVVCVSETYGSKPWAQAEHEAIRARLMHARGEKDLRQRDRIFPIRVGEGNVEGIPSTAIVHDVREWTPQRVAELIADRLQYVMEPVRAAVAQQPLNDRNPGSADGGTAPVSTSPRSAITGATPAGLPVARSVALPTPAYPSAEVQALSEQIERARGRKQELCNEGLATDEVDREILQLRRKLREGGQLRAGDSLGNGRYLLVKPVGRGGFGVVWEAFDRTEQRNVAIKVLHQHLASDPKHVASNHPHLANDPQRKERFFRGARVMMELKHPAVVGVYDPRGEDEAYCYFVMELVRGGNLRDAVLGKRVEAERRLAIILQVGQALAEAHRKQLVHRDIKPANVMLDDKGDAKLTDFDLVGAQDTTGGTRTGAMGSYLYAAPECHDKPQDATARADVFGLGMTAIFCLLGQELTMDTYLDICKEPAETLSSLDCPHPVRHVLARAVARKPEQRFADAGEMVAALRKSLDKQKPEEQPTELESTLRESASTQPGMQMIGGDTVALSPVEQAHLAAQDRAPQTLQQSVDVEPAISRVLEPVRVAPQQRIWQPATARHGADDQAVATAEQRSHHAHSEETVRSTKFVILRSLAMGGKAEILLARVREPARPERLVVLKRMHRHLAADRESVKRFVDEARLAITLRHPNVVEVYESGEADGQYYIAMEYLHGHDLRRVLSQMAKRGVPMRLANALSIARAVCRGLDYTHERTDANGELLGIVHRDVSPHNVRVTYGGRVKLVDFGSAQTTIQLARTRTGILEGKVAYMSPEQALGEPLDRRSDVFCVGILLWEMTTGHWLYRRRSELETLKAVVEHDAPLPSLRVTGYPRELEQIVLKTLARKRDDRWATAGELGEALSAFAKQRRLDLRPAALSALMSSTFQEEVQAWHTARSGGLTLGDHLADTEDREITPILNGRFPPNAATIEDVPTTGAWPQSGQAPSGWRWLRWRPQWLQQGPALLQARWRWMVIAAVVALAAAGLLVSELLRGDDSAPPARRSSAALPSTSAG